MTVVGSVAQRQSGGLISLRLLVRVQPSPIDRVRSESPRTRWFPSSNGKDPRLSPGEWRVRLPPGTFDRATVQRVAQFGSAVCQRPRLGRMRLGA